jgi:prepilin-type N-terminal cleavage/methylation domain-containing protein
MIAPQRGGRDKRSAVTRGFTLVELLVTVFVMSIAALIVIPSMGSTGIIRVQAIAREIIGDIAFIQSDAVAYQERRVIWFGKIPQAASGSGLWTFSDGNGYTVGIVEGPEFDLQTMWMPGPGDLDVPFFRNFTKRDGQTDGVISASFGQENSDWLIFDELGGTAGSLTGTEPGPGGTIAVTSPLVTYEVDVEGLTGRTTVKAIDK